MAVDEVRLSGGRDAGAVRVGATVRRPWRPWSESVQHLLGHLVDAGVPGVPRPLGRDDDGREIVEYLPGDTVGEQLPWPAWTHGEQALEQVGDWLRRYHAAALTYRPPTDERWRDGTRWAPGLVVAHNDAAPYNATWDRTGLRGFFDWDNAGACTVEDDVAWVALSWTPLHARRVVSAEGFTAFGRRRERLDRFLAAYDGDIDSPRLLAILGARVQRQIDDMHRIAAAGDLTYQGMLARGEDAHLHRVLDELADL